MYKGLNTGKTNINYFKVYKSIFHNIIISYKILPILKDHKRQKYIQLQKMVNHENLKA